MKKLAVLGVLAMFVLATVAMAAAPKAVSAFAKKPAVGTEAKDLVSGKAFKTTADTPWIEQGKKFYGFENQANADLFKADPAKYLPKKAEKKAEPKKDEGKKAEPKKADPAPAPAPK